MAAASGGPHLTDGPFFFRIGAVIKMFTLVFDRHDPPIRKLAYKIRIEPIGRCLQPEGSGLSRKVADPETDFRQAVDELRASEFLRDVADQALLPQFSRFGAKVVLLELKASFIEFARLIAHRPEIDRARLIHRQGGIGQKKHLERTLSLGLTILLNAPLNLVPQPEPVENEKTDI